jgi:hypothetical protein
MDYMSNRRLQDLEPSWEPVIQHFKRQESAAANLNLNGVRSRDCFIAFSRAEVLAVRTGPHMGQT